MCEFFVYILRCSDNSYYIGVTNDYEKRIAEHKEGFDPLCYTFKRRPLTLVHLETFPSILDAISREKQLKRWSRKKKEALIRKMYERLPSLATCRNATHFSLYKNICHTMDHNRRILADALRRPSTTLGMT